MVLRLSRLVLLACLMQGPCDSARAFLLAILEQFEVHGTGSRFEEKWGHTVALRASAALPRHYLCCALV